MNTGKLVSFLLGAVAAVVLIVLLAVFLHKKGAAKPEETKPAEADSTAAPELPAQGAAAGVLNVVTFMRDSSVEDMRNLTGSYLLDARAKTNYQSVGQTVTVVTSDLEDAPGYTKLTHTLPSPFKGTEVVFDAVSRLPTFEHPVASLAAYWWQNTLLFLTFKTVNQSGQPAATKFYHFSANRTEVGLRWSRVMVDHTNDLDPTVLAGKLDEVNTLFGNVVALHLDEFLDEATGTYTSEFGGVPTTFTLSKRPFTQAGFMKVTHKLLEAGSEAAKPFKLKKVLVSGAALTDLVLPKKPLTTVAVYWWHNTPLLAELDLVGDAKDHFVYNLDANNWLNEPVEKVRSTLTLLKNNLGVPLTMDLGKKGAATDATYTTNEVLVRVSGPAPDSPRGFPKYTHRFASGKSHFVGTFLNSGTPQNGLPFARVNEVSVFFSDEVPLLVQMNMSGSGSLSTKRVFYSNNGFGFWSRVMLTETLKDTDAVLKKLDAENKKLVSTNDKYVVDVVMKSDYLSVGKLLKVAKQNLDSQLKAYTMYQHNRKNNEAFKFQKLVAVGKDVTTEGLEELTGVTNAKVYWFLDTPLLVHLTGTTRVLTSNTTPAAPVPNPSQLPTSQAQGAGAGGVVPGVAVVGGGVAGGGAGQPSVPGAPGVAGQSGGVAPGVGAGGAGVQATAATTLQASSPVAATTTTKAVNHYYSFNGESKKWVKVEYTVVGDGQTNRLKTVLDGAKATLGSVTLQVGHGAGAYRTGPVTVTVTNATSQSKYGGGVFDMMLHTMSAPFPLGKLKHFDFDVNLIHVPLKENESVAPEPPATDRPEVAYPMDFNAVGMEVYVYKYVPLVAALKMEEGNTLFFANTLAESKWRMFTFDNDSKVGEKLEELRNKLTAVSSLDVCKKHEADTAATYTLKPAVGAGTVNVALSKLEGVSDGMKGVLHTLPSAQKLGSLTCGDEVLTGLDCGNVNKVAVYFKGDSPAVVKANSVPKYFTLNPQGGLSRHVLPPDATDLNAQQVTELVATVANKMGSVLEFNMEMRNNYNVASGLQMKVAHLDLGGTWSLYTHTLGDNETFTVSKFMKGSKDVVGLPHNKLLSAVYLGFKGNEPKLLGLKTVSPAAYEWHVFDKYRWLFDFSTETLLEDDEVLAVLEDVDDGLENEFALDLALEATPEVFLFDHVKLADAALTGFARNTYTVADLMYPFLLGALQFNSDVLTATDLATHHLNALTAYTYMDEPVLLHGLTFDKKSVFFETNFAAVFNAVDLGEFNEEALKARLLALKAKAAGLVTVELTAKAGYKNYEKDVLVNEKTDAGLDTFKKYEHKLLETPNTGGTAGTKPTAFTFRKVKYNNTLLELVLPEGTVTSVNTFLGSDDVPAGFHFVLTPPPAAAPAQQPAQPSGPVASQPAPAVATAMHHYFFHKAGKWEPMTNATELAANDLKAKLLEAEKTFERKVTVNLANKVTHEVWNRVEDASGQVVADSAAGQGDANTRTRKTLNFLVEASPKEVNRMKTYTHVPQLKTVVGTGNPTTGELAPYVLAFTLGEQKLGGFEMNKVEKFTVFWLDDTYPVMALLKTPSAHKFYRLAREYEWVLAKSVADEPTETLVFEMTTLARNAFTYEASVDVGMDTGLGTAFKYRSGQLTMRVVDAGLLGTNYRVFVHASTSVFAPAFLLDDLNLFGAAGLRSLHALGFVREVKVFANLDRFPLLVEVAATTLKHPRAAPRYHYYKFNQALAPDKTGGAAGSGAPLLFVKTTDVKLPEKELLELLKTLDAVRSTTFVVKLDAKASYNPKEQVTFTVARTTPAAQNGNFEVYDHTFPVTVNAGATAAASHAKKTLVLMVGDKKVGFVTKDGGFTSVTVHWFSGVPVHAALKFGTATKDYLNYFFFGGEHWTTVFDLGVEFALANKQMLYQKLSPHFATKYLDFGNKTLSTQFGVVTDLKLVDYKPEGLKLPDGLVGYTFEWPDAGHQVVKMLNFGWDFDALELELPPGDVKEVHVFSPEGFYAPVFAEVKTNVLVTPGTTSPQKAAEYKDVYNYFHVTSSGFWTTLYTKGAKLDNETLALRLAKVADPAPALVDLGKREGTYGLPKMLVEKTFFSTAHTYARYEHKLAVGENFLMTRWVFGGLQMEDLPALKADYVAAYFYEDAVPLLLEVNNAGFVRFFAPDANGHWMPENVSRTAVSAFLDNLVHEMTLVASHSEEWVPHLNTKFLRQMELVPQVKVVAVPVPESAKAAAAVVPAPGDASTAPGTPVPSPAPEPAAPGAPDAAAAAAAAAKASGAGAVEPQVTPVQAPVVSSAANVQQTSNLQGAGQVASGLGGVGAGAGAGGAGAEPGAATTQAQQGNAAGTDANARATTATGPQAPAGKPATEVQAVVRTGGPGSPVRPAAPQVPVANVEAPVNAKREFKPALFNYEDLFHGYLTLGKFVKVARFDTVPNGYNFGKHSFVNGGRYYANKFLLGGKEYALPVEAGASTKSRLASSLAFYSWSTNPLMLKLGLHAKAPVFFSYNKTNDTWAKATVVNLDEELEHLNNLNDVYVFDLAKPNGRHNYYNNRSYYVSDGPQVLPELFKSAEFETFRQVQAKLGENQLEHHEKVPFKLGKLRLNGVDYPSDGLPDDTVFYFMHVFTSKASKKPLLLVFYDDQDERDRKKFEKANPGKFLGHYFQWNLDGTWSRFVPEGADAVVNKLRELEALFAVPLTLDLAKVTGTAGLLNYKANGNDFVVERVFVPAVRAPAEAPARGPAPSDLDVEASTLLGGRVGARDVPGPAGSQGGVVDTPEPALRPAAVPGGPGTKVVLEDPVVQTRVALGTGDTVGPAAPAAPQPARAGAAAQSGQSVAGQAGFTLVTRGVTPLSQPGAPTPPVAGPGPHPGEGRVAGVGPQPVHQGGVPDKTNPSTIRGGAEVSGNGNGGTQNQNNGQDTTVSQSTTSTSNTATTVNTGSSGVPGVGVPGVGVPGASGSTDQNRAQQQPASNSVVTNPTTSQTTVPPNTVTVTTPTGQVTTVQSGGQPQAGAKAAVTPGQTAATGVPTGSGLPQGTGAAAPVGVAGGGNGQPAASNVAIPGAVGTGGVAVSGVAGAAQAGAAGVGAKAGAGAAGTAAVGAGGVPAGQAGQPAGPASTSAAAVPRAAEPQPPTKPVAADGSQLNVLPEVTALPAGAAFVDVAFVAHSGPVPATEENAGFELYHHHAPFFVHRFTEQGKTEVKKVVKAKKFNVKKLAYGGVDLDFAAPFEPAEGGYAGMTVFYEKNVKTPFAFALFTLKNEADAEKVHYDVWVHRDLKWVKTEELDAFYNLMRALEMKNSPGSMEGLVTKFTEKLAELAAAAKAMLPNVFSLDLKQDDTVKFGSVVVDKDADLVDGLDMLKQEFKPRMLSPPVGWVDFSLDSVALHGNRYVGLKLPMVGVHAVYTYFRNSPDRYARFPAVMEMVQKLKGYNRPVFKHWYYVYAGANEWRLHFYTFDKLDDHDVFDMLNARLYEYHRVSEFHKGALMLDLDTKFSHVSMGRFVDAVEFFHDPASTNSPVPEGFLLYRHAMATENSTFKLPFVKLQGEVRETGFKHPFAQYFLYFKVGYVVPLVVVLAQKDNVTDQPTHHWYFVKGHELVKFKFAGAADVDPDNHVNKAVVTAKFKELLQAAPEPLKEADALKADPPADTVMPAFPASDPTVFSKAVNGVDPAAVPRSGASPQAQGAVDARPDVLNLADGLPSAAGTDGRTDTQRSDTGAGTRPGGVTQTSEQRNTGAQSGTRQQTPERGAASTAGTTSQGGDLYGTYSKGESWI